MRVAIVGSGISGVTLALRLQQLGVEATLFAGRTPDEMRAAPLPNTVARFDHTLRREQSLAVDHWSGAGHAFRCLQFAAGAPVGIRFDGRAATAVEAVDFRVLLPRWTEDFATRGGTVDGGPLPADGPGLERLVSGHDLVVVAVGRTSMASLFPVDRQRSPYAAPQRVLLAGIFEGLNLPEPLAFSFNISPGAGEIFQMPILTADGLASNILLEAIPGGRLARVATRPPGDPVFLRELHDALRDHAPAIAARVDASRFALRSPLDLVQGAVTPAVRHAFATLGNGTPAVAIGDAWVTNDPITGQGANVGSHCAFVAANAIAAGGPFDAAWAARLEAAMWAFAGPVTAWTNAFLQPPPAHVVALLRAAAEHQAVADAFVSAFAAPAELASALAEPSATDTFIASARAAEPVG